MSYEVMRDSMGITLDTATNQWAITKDVKYPSDKSKAPNPVPTEPDDKDLRTAFSNLYLAEGTINAELQKLASASDADRKKAMNDPQSDYGKAVADLKAKRVSLATAFGKSSAAHRDWSRYSVATMSDSG
jgi:hypothetical protein